MSVNAFGFELFERAKAGAMAMASADCRHFGASVKSDKKREASSHGKFRPMGR